MHSTKRYNICHCKTLYRTILSSMGLLLLLLRCHGEVSLRLVRMWGMSDKDVDRLLNRSVGNVLTPFSLSLDWHCIYIPRSAVAGCSVVGARDPDSPSVATSRPLQRIQSGICVGPSYTLRISLLAACTSFTTSMRKSLGTRLPRRHT